MNVYDFDNTIYLGDSTLDFYFFCLKNQPSIIRILPLQIYWFMVYKFKKISKTEFKEKFYAFLSILKNIDKLLEDFWKQKQHFIKDFYLNQQQENDVIISASPYFLLEPICNKLKIKHLIASNVDKCSGKYSGLNCYGEEKVNRFEQFFSLSDIENFYSDSLSDAPLAHYAKNAFLVHNNYITKWKKVH